MPSDHQKKSAQKKKELAKAKGGKKLDAGDEPKEVASAIMIMNRVSKEKTPDLSLTYEEELCLCLQDEARLAAEARACTGVLGIHPQA